MLMDFRGFLKIFKFLLRISISIQYFMLQRYLFLPTHKYSEDSYLLPSNILTFFLYNKMSLEKIEEDYKPENQRTFYRRVSMKTKERLLKLVISEGKKISTSARILRLNISTAKMILSRYRRKLAEARNKQDPQKETENQQNGSALKQVDSAYHQLKNQLKAQPISSTIQPFLHYPFFSFFCLYFAYE